MSDTSRPPFDAELAEFLKLMPPQDDTLSPHESILATRERIAPLNDPQTVLGDPDIVHEEVTIPGPSGDIILSILRHKHTSGGSQPGIYSIHGGGMVIGNRFFGLNTTIPWIKETNAVVISPEYRLAPEYPDPAQVDDCWAGLKWVGENLSKLGINPEKLIVAGASAGGGLAAGMALKARDENGPKLCGQLLLYPMLDDRVTSVSSVQYMSLGTYTGEANIQNWDMVLPGKRGTKNVSIYMVPARATSLKDLPHAYIETGSAEPFRDENVAYASQMWFDAGQVALHVMPGAWHGYDHFAPQAQISKDALVIRMQWLKRILLE